MGHGAVKDVYRQLGDKIDNLTMRAPWNDALHSIIKELYSEEEADVVVKMPYLVSNLDRIARITGLERDRLKGILDGLAEKGLVLDLYHDGRYYYMPSPYVVGIFEFTMMRTRGDLNTKEWARLLNAYMSESEEFIRANFGEGQSISFVRTIPHSGTVAPAEAVEILSYEKAEAIVESQDRFSIGTCSCRHKQLHLGLKTCATPLDTCSGFGHAADYMNRHGFGKVADSREMLDNLQRSRQLGLVLTADSVKRNVMYICHCCSCCCHILEAVNKFGYHNFLITSSYIAGVNASKCTGCGKCASACPVNSISMRNGPAAANNATQRRAVVDASFCLGCGVCALQCETRALQLHKRKQKVIHPDTTFERNILQCLERGTLQNLIFDNPRAVTHKVMRGIIGGFLRLSPVKKALMSDSLRSTFLSMLAAGSKITGHGWLTCI